MAAPPPLRINIKAHCVEASGDGAAASPFVKTGSITVIAAVASQARVLANVRVVALPAAGAAAAPSGPVKSADVDKIQPGAVLSFTVGALGAVSVPLDTLTLDVPHTHAYPLLGGTSTVSFALNLTLTLSAGSLASRTPARPASSSTRTPATASATGGGGEGRATAAATAMAVETVVIKAAPPAPAPAPAPAPPPAPAPAPPIVVVPAPEPAPVVAAPPPAPVEPEPIVEPRAPTPPPPAPAPAPNPVIEAPAPEPAPVLPAFVGGVAPVTEGPPITGGSTPLPTRLIDYFAVMLTDDRAADAAEDGSGASMDDVDGDALDSDPEDATGVGASPVTRTARAAFKRRVGIIGPRYPEEDHPDLPFPANMDWFIFPNGIAPVLQPASVGAPPPTRRSVFVLSNVGGSTLATTMYGCCLTAFREEEVNRDDEDEHYETHPERSATRMTKWWPVVLFMLSRLPIVPQLQVILEKFYDIYDRGTSTGIADKSTLSKAYCSLAEYLRMLVYEAPVPIRRLNMAVQLFLPGETPRLEPPEDSTCTVFLPSPECLPAVQFDSRKLLSRFSSHALLRLVASMVQENRLVFIARSVEQIVETVEVAMALLYPLSWEMPYIPVLPAHLAADLLSSPVPFCYGLLTCYAARVLHDVVRSDATELIVVDVTTGNVDKGIDAYLARRQAQVDGHAIATPSMGDEGHAPLEFPEPLAGDLRTEVDAIAASASSMDASECNIALQAVFCRFFAVLLYGYRPSTFFPGCPPQYSAHLSTDAYVATKTQLLLASVSLARASALKAASAGGAVLGSDVDVDAAHAFYASLCSTQCLQRLLQRHTSIYLRPFHALTSMLSTSPTLAETKKWTPPVAAISHTIVVPPPGYTSLFPWQPRSVVALIAGVSALTSRSATHTGMCDRQLPPSPATGMTLPPRIKAKKGSKKDKKESELARRFTSGEVAASVCMSPWETQELDLLAAAAAKGDNGPRGDDVGGSPEDSDVASQSNTALLLSVAAEAAGADSNPVVGRRAGAGTATEDMRRALARRKAKEVAAARAATKSTRRGWFRSAAAAEPTSEDAAASVETQEARDEEALYGWLQDVLVTGVIPASAVNAGGVSWSADDDRIAACMTSPVNRASFVKVLQAQVLLSAGLSAPLAGAVQGDSVQLQPLLGLGVSEHSLSTSTDGTTSSSTSTSAPPSSSALPSASGFGGTRGHRAAKTLLVQHLPVARFQRLAAMCAIVLARCDGEQDYSVAAALLQVAFFFYAEPGREMSATTSTGRAGKSGWGIRRQYLNQELAGESIWRKLAFWDAYVAGALAVEDQQTQLLHAHAQRHGVSAAGETAAKAGSSAQAVTTSGMTYMYTLIQSLLSPMLQMGVFAHEVRAWVQRTAAKQRMGVDEERTVLSLIDHLAAAEASSGSSGATSATSMLGSYTAFVRGNALTQAAMAAGDRSSTPASTAAQSSKGVAATAAVSKSTPPAGGLPAAVPLAQGAAPSTAASSSPAAAAPPPAAAVGTNGAAVTSAPAASEQAAASAATTTATPAASSATATDAVKAGISNEPEATAVPTLAPTAQPPAPAPVAAASAAPVPAPAPAPPSSAPAVAPVAVPQHPWFNLAPRDAEAGALGLVGERRFPPVPEKSVLSRPKSFRGKPHTTDVSKSAVAAATNVPDGGVSDASAAAHASASAPASPAKAPAPAPAAPPTSSKKMPIVKAFGSAGLSVIASSFAAALPGGGSPAAGAPAASPAPAPAGSAGAHGGSDASLLDGMLHTIARAAIRAAHGPGALPAGQDHVPAAVSMSCLAFRGHAAGAAITCLSHDLEDHRVVTGGNDGRVVLWDMLNRTFVHSYEEHTAAVTSVKLCGDVIVSAAQDGTIRLSSFARLAYGAAVQTLPASAATASGAAKPTPGQGEDFDDDEDDGEGDVDEASSAAARGAPAGGAPGTVSTADYLAGGGAAEAPAPTAAAPKSAAASAMKGITNAFNNIATIPFPFPVPTMLGASSRGSHRFMSAVRLKGHSGPVTAVDAWERPEERKTGWFGRKTAETPGVRTLPSSSNYIIVSGGSDGSIRTWAARWNVNKSGKANGTALHLSTITSLHKPGSIIEQVKLSVDGRLCASAGRDGRIGVVDVATGKTWVMMMPSASRGLFSWGSGPSAPIDPVAAPTGLPLVSCSIDVTRRPVMITSAGADGTARVWDLRTGAVAVAFPSAQPVWCFSTVPAHGGGVPTYDADGTMLSPPAPLGDYFLLTGHEDGAVRKWDSRKPAVPMAAWAGHATAVTSLSALGDKLVTGSVDGAVRLWDAATGVSLRCDGHSRSASCVSANEDYFLSASWDGTLRCWFPAS